jgi:phage head maturation protease
VDAGGARLLRQARDQLLDLLAHHHHQVGQLVDHDDHVRQPLQRLGLLRRQAERVGIFSPRALASSIFLL